MFSWCQVSKAGDLTAELLFLVCPANMLVMGTADSWKGFGSWRSRCHSKGLPSASLVTFIHGLFWWLMEWELGSSSIVFPSGNLEGSAKKLNDLKCMPWAVLVLRLAPTVQQQLFHVDNPVHQKQHWAVWLYFPWLVSLNDVLSPLSTYLKFFRNC